MLSFGKTLSKKADKISVSGYDERMYGGFGANTSSDNASYPAEKITLNAMSFVDMDKMYIANIWVRAVIDKIVERVNNVKPVIKPVKTIAEKSGNNSSISDETLRHIEILNGLLIKPNFNNESFYDIRKKITRDLLKYDAAGLEITKGVGSNRDDVPLVEIYSVAGDTIKLNVNDNGLLNNEAAYLQVLNGSSLKSDISWNKDELIYMMLKPQSNRVYGLSPLESLYQTVTAELYASNYNSDFFFNNATPRYAVLMEGMGIGQGTTAMKRFRQWWDQELKGKPHKPIILGTENGTIKFEKVSLTNEEMQFQEYSKWLLIKIMVAFFMQPAVLGIADSSINKMDIKEQTKQFKIDAVQPQLITFSTKFNQQIIFNKEVYGYKDVYLGFDLDLGDRGDKSEVDERYVRMGAITINEIRRELGMTPVQWGNVPYMQNNLVPFGIGPNGQALPFDPNSQNVSSPKEPAVPNISTSSKRFIKNYIMSNTGNPIGWEDIELNDRIDIIMKLLKDKEDHMRKYFYDKEQK